MRFGVLISGVRVGLIQSTIDNRRLLIDETEAMV